VSKVAKSLLPLALAVWVVHAVLRVLLLFRVNPYGTPFVNKPDWYIFHAITWDYMWIAISLAVCALIIRRYYKIAFIAFHSIILLLTYLDQETQRFLGSHVSFSLVNAYKDPSSVEIFWEYFAYDQSVPFLQVAVLLLMFPSFYFLNKLFARYFNKKTSFRSIFIGGTAFFLCCWLFINVIWTGGSRRAKLTPVVDLIYKEIVSLATNKKESLSEEEILEYQNFWKEIDDGNSNISFLKEYPLWKEYPNSQLSTLNSQLSNFIVIFLESHRYVDVKKSSPFLDSLMNASLNFIRMHVSGLPTTGGLLSSLTGIPTHSSLTQVTSLPFIKMPSFAHYLRGAGWRADFFSAADPAWDNLGVWLEKWYDKQHYNREREDDSLFWDYASMFVKDSLANNSQPFLATFITRSNHYPFDFAANMPKSEKDKSIQERIIYTMNYADRQLARFVHSIQNEPWFENTYLIILADHGFPLGENGNSTISGGAYYSSTHIPFIIAGKNIPQKTDTISASQIDIAPTILELAGIETSNPFMGHSLLKKRKNFALGTHFGYKTLSYGNFRLIYKAGAESLLFENSDSLQTRELSKENKETVLEMEKLVNMLIKVSDFSLENDIVGPK